MRRISDFISYVILRLWDLFPSPGVILRGFTAALIVAVAGMLLLQPDPREDVRAADRLFLAGQYHDALAAYSRLDAQFPEIRLRLGMLRVLRDEPNVAERALYDALQQGLRPGLYQQGLLYLGRTQADDGRTERAAATWALIEDCRSPVECAYRGPARLLLAEAALQRGDYPAAEAGMRAALEAGLPADWAGLARYRLALLQAPRDQQAALRWLNDAPPDNAPEPWLTPLLPAYADGAGQLAAVLANPNPQQAQQLGQIYLGLGWYALAEAQFAQVDPSSPDALGAAAYAAYTRYRAGDMQGGLARLEELVQAYPDEPRARTLLALSYLAAADAEAAATQLDTVAELTPNNPDVQLAWASWYAAEREYAEAALAYGRAIAQAPQPERPRYALLAARFHLTTTFDLCIAGLPVAEQAAEGLTNSSEAWTVLAAVRYRCGQFANAAEAAQQAQQLGGGPEAAYYHGASLAALGATVEARSALIRAADLAPGSIWRARAEYALATLP